MTTQKPRRHFIAWSPIRARAFRAASEDEAQNLARDYEWNMPPRPTWKRLAKEGWRVTEVSE